MTERPRHQPATHTFTAQLDQEWERLRRHRQSLASARSWAAHVDADLAPVFDAVDDLDEIVAQTQRGASADANRIISSLVALAADEQLAGRIVVQRLLPGLVAAASKYRFLCAENDPAELAVGALWIALRRYDHSTRRRQVAASLISDAIFAAFRRQTRLRSAGEEAHEPSKFELRIAPERTHPFEELAAVIGEARVSGVPSSDLDLLRHLVQVESPGLVARQRDVTPRTVRNHRDRATARVREAIAA